MCPEMSWIEFTVGEWIPFQIESFDIVIEENDSLSLDRQVESGITSRLFYIKRINWIRFWISMNNLIEDFCVYAQKMKRAQCSREI